MERKHVKKKGRIWSRLISVLLVAALLGNDCLGGIYTVSASSSEETVITEAPQTEVPEPEDSPESEASSETTDSPESEDTPEETGTSDTEPTGRRTTRICICTGLRIG